jgi:hypothetical protein
MSSNSMWPIQAGASYLSARMVSIQRVIFSGTCEVLRGLPSLMHIPERRVDRRCPSQSKERVDICERDSSQTVGHQ